MKRGLLVALLLKGLVEAVAIAIWLMAGIAHGESLAQCPSGTKCTVTVYSSADSTQFTSHTIELAVPHDANGNPTPITGTSVNFLYDGQQYTVTCDGSQHDLGPSTYPELADRITCAVDMSGTTPGTRVTVSLKLHDQDTYAHDYTDCPAYTNDPTLKDTDENSPYCVNDSDHNAGACKWEKQNVNDTLLTQRGIALNDWVIYAETTVSALDLGFSVEPPPPYSESELICAEDLNGNGQLDENEVQECISTPQGNLCPVGAEECTFDEVSPTCPEGGSYNPATDRCEAAITVNHSCPSGYTLDGDLCVADPVCPSGGSYNPATDRCEANLTTTETTHTCYTVSGWLFGWPGWPDPNWQACHGSCPSSPQCPNNTQPSGSTKTGYKDTDPTVYGGYYLHHHYEWFQWIEYTYSCPSGYTRSGSVCVATATCPSGGGTLDANTDKCEMTATTTTSCSSGYTQSGDLCVADAICPSGYDLNGSKDKCISLTPECPYGSQYTCMNNGGTWECSKNDCTQYGATDQEDDDTPQGATDKQDDGPKDSDGNCLGQIYIFNGHDKRCRNASMYTSWTNCCFTGSEDNCERKNWLGQEACNSDEQGLACQRRNGLCHYVGSYCAKKMSVGLGKICTQYKKTYCCFSSKLGRIIQEQGRSQLKSFDSALPWGLPTAPNCRGFTPEEFEMLDFGKIDLSEWYNDVVTRSQQQIQNETTTKTQQFYNRFTGGH